VASSGHCPLRPRGRSGRVDPRARATPSPRPWTGEPPSVQVDRERGRSHGVLYTPPPLTEALVKPCWRRGIGRRSPRTLLSSGRRRPGRRGRCGYSIHPAAAGSSCCRSPGGCCRPRSSGGGPDQRRSSGFFARCTVWTSILGRRPWPRSIFRSRRSAHCASPREPIRRPSSSGSTSSSARLPLVPGNSGSSGQRLAPGGDT